MTLVQSLLHVVIALAMAPLLPGIIARAKAFFGGRRGRPLLQGYYDLLKLAGKGAVYSRTTTWIFRLGPVLGLAVAVTALMILPVAGIPSLLAFPGDFLLFVYLLALGRFLTMAAALDTGSAFEGMGASREAACSALAEPALFIGLGALALNTQSWSLHGVYTHLAWTSVGLPALALVFGAFFLVLLVENSRIPFDDPETHLELTMIHEVMVLDHSGPDFLFIQYGAMLKLWLTGALLTNLVVPVGGASYAVRIAVFLICQCALAVAVGVVESTMARLRLVRVPQMLVSAAILSLLAFLLLLRPMTP